MEVWIVLTLDRHSDAGVEVFEHIDKAHEFAAARAWGFSLDGKCEVVAYPTGVTAYNYSVEGDRIEVMKREVQ